MKRICIQLAVLVVVGIAAPRSLAQDAAAPAVPAQASGIVGLCQLLEAKIKECKAKICACPLGQMITSGQAVGNLALGGLLCPPCCPAINPDDLKKPSNTAAGACAKIMQDQAGVAARRASVRCLSRADCHW